MVDARLVQYLKTYLSQGYNREQLESHLVAQGWNRNDLDQAFGQISPKAEKPKFSFFGKPKQQVQQKPQFQQKPAVQAQPVMQAKPVREERPRAYAEAGVAHVERPSSHFVPVAVLACVFLLVGMFFYSYFYVINPTFVTKPVLTKPDLPTVGSAVSTKQVEYALNELDFYKLHGNPVG